MVDFLQHEFAWQAASTLGSALFAFLLGRRQAASKETAEEREYRLRDRTDGFKELREVVRTLRREMDGLQDTLDDERKARQELQKALDEQYRLRAAAEGDVKKLRAELHDMRNAMQRQAAAIRTVQRDAAEDATPDTTSHSGIAS